ncbi:MAG: ABC transporter permease [Actinobacteria bacterium]|nr:ABC transporter permease [Actinomycetota bacterium]MBT5502080.1 ABC transporter permease [Actinomycetota bacterium]MBT5807512.1 ABC transporter permease [Actinomycetota bacterium]
MKLGKKAKEPERFALIGVWAVLIVFFALVIPDTFPTLANLSNMLGSQAVLLILALGLIIPLRAGDYDLSIGSVLAMSAVTVAALNVNYGWPVWAAAVVAVFAGILVGLFNGFIVTKFDINPFIVTLGMGTVIVGISYMISNTRTITGVDPALSEAVLAKPFLGIPVDFYYAMLLCLVVWYMFEYTAFGQRLLFIGQNKDVARLNGVPVSRSRLLGLTLSATVASLAGVVYVGTTGSADTTSGAGFLLPAFAAAFLGSTTIRIGRFNPWGTFIAVYFLVTGITGLQLMGFPQYVQYLFYGGALVIAVVLSKIVAARSERKRIALEAV